MSYKASLFSPQQGTRVPSAYTHLTLTQAFHLWDSGGHGKTARETRSPQPSILIVLFLRLGLTYKSFLMTV